ncbi:hypothetical protein P43SY_006172 [Pythium insidiosum]|uniref:Uncharacterized protein n=1 Tax=Pythium insidiosum TaxID=114742 RepID=A0AAD5LGR1_PYTIN|nr:hypothetical protein P43SY_006172 [Pythium insidiosum]
MTRVASAVHSRILDSHRALFSKQGVFGLESRHFETIFVLREAVETTLQIYQAYRMAQYLPRPSLNHAFVGLLAANCWTTPLLHAIVRHRPLQRMLCILADIVLDFVASIGVPAVLALSYLPEANFPPSLWYNDAWAITFINESSIVLCASWVDVANRILFSVSMMLCLDDIKALLMLRSSASAARVAQQPDSKMTPTSTDKDLANSSVPRAVKWMHGVIILTGFAVLATHSANEFSSLLQDLEPHSLAQITFRHCAHIQFTPDVQRFSQLLGLKLYNSTVESWPAESAIDSRFHSKILFTYFVRTLFPNQTIPDGLRSRSFPQQLKDIEFCVTNIKTLPDDVHLSWPPLLTLVVEYAQLETVPTALQQLRPSEIGLCGNPIQAVESWVVMLPDLETLILCNTPITALPSKDIDASAIAIRTFSLRYSNMTTPPPWMTPEFSRDRRILAGGTPLCKALDSPEDDGPIGLSPQDQAALRAVINCVDSKRYYFYPIAYDERAEETW